MLVDLLRTNTIVYVLAFVFASILAVNVLALLIDLGLRAYMKIRKIS